MDHLKQLNDAMHYIEAHLTEELDYQKIGQVAYCSDHHFRRMFSFLAGISLSEYVRLRRLSLAAIDLKSESTRIIDVAVKYGYQSADAFSRAFLNFHGILPSEARGNETMIKVYPKMTFQLSIQGGHEMNYRIVEKEAFKIIGLKKNVKLVTNGINPEIVEMAKSLTPEIIVRLKSLSNVSPQGMISASANFSEGRMEGQATLDHIIGVATNEDETFEFDILEVSKSTWAVFESIGPFPETLQKVWGRIYSEWFPSSGYESTNGPEIVWHESPDTSSPTYKSEIWIPVKKIL